MARWLEVLAANEILILFSRQSITAAKIAVVEIGAMACVRRVLFLALLTLRERKNIWEEYGKEGKKELHSDYYVIEFHAEY